MNIPDLSSLLSCYAVMSTGENLTDIQPKNETTKEGGDHDRALQNSRLSPPDVNGNPLANKSKMKLPAEINQESAEGLLTVTSAAGEGPFEEDFKNAFSEDVVGEKNGNHTLSCLHVQTTTHHNKFTQTHWHLYTQTPSFSLFTEEDEPSILTVIPDESSGDAATPATEDNAPRREIPWDWKGTDVMSEDLYISSGGSVYTYDSFGTKLEWKGGSQTFKIGKFQLHTQQQKDKAKFTFSIGIETQNLDYRFCDVFQDDENTIYARAQKNRHEIQLRFRIRNRNEASVVKIQAPKVSSSSEENMAWISFLS